MTTRKPLLPYEEAIKLIEQLPQIEGRETLALSAARGRRLAETLAAKVDSPPFTNSAMDGFALRFSEHQDSLKIVGTVWAQPNDPTLAKPVGPGECVRIMTGAVLPDWADTVVPVEKAQVSGDEVRFEGLIKAGQNIREMGEDLRQGEPVLPAGSYLDPERLMLAAAFGHSHVEVVTRPRVGLFSTGDELAQPGESLAPGQIYNSSMTFLETACQRIGLEASVASVLPDDPEIAGGKIHEFLQTGGPHLVVTTGAVSAGDKDFIPSLAKELGFEPLFHKVAIRPGKPIFLAKQCENIWLGLAGNAISTNVGWHFFGRQLLAHWAGTKPPVQRPVELQNDVRKPEGLRCFYRAELNRGLASVASQQGSARLAASIASSGFVVLPEGKDLYQAGSKLMSLEME